MKLYNYNRFNQEIYIYNNIKENRNEYINNDLLTNINSIISKQNNNFTMLKKYNLL